MSQTSTSTPKVMPSYSNLWEACIANLCCLPLTQTQRCPAPLMPAAPSTTMVSCSPPHPEMYPWALRPQTTSPSEMSSQSTTCPMVLRTAPRDCMTELETGCSGSISCTRGSIPRMTCMRPVGLFRRIFGEYSVSPRPPYNPFSYPVCGVRLLTVKPLFHLF